MIRFQAYNIELSSNKKCVLNLYKLIESKFNENDGCNIRFVNCLLNEERNTLEKSTIMSKFS